MFWSFDIRHCDLFVICDLKFVIFNTLLSSKVITVIVKNYTKEGKLT